MLGTSVLSMDAGVGVLNIDRHELLNRYLELVLGLLVESSNVFLQILG